MAEDLYHDAIIKEARAKVGAGRLSEPTVTVERDNPLCGDRITLDVKATGLKLDEVGHTTRGCLLTQAAASVVSRHAGAITLEEARRARQSVERLLAGDADGDAWPELAIFGPVQAVRSRHECVLLPFQALEEALERLQGGSGD